MNGSCSFLSQDLCIFQSVCLPGVKSCRSQHQFLLSSEFSLTFLEVTVFWLSAASGNITPKVKTFPKMPFPSSSWGCLASIRQVFTIGVHCLGFKGFSSEAQQSAPVSAEPSVVESPGSPAFATVTLGSKLERLVTAMSLWMMWLRLHSVPHTAFCSLAPRDQNWLKTGEWGIKAPL